MCQEDNFSTNVYHTQNQKKKSDSHYFKVMGIQVIIFSFGPFFGVVSKSRFISIIRKWCNINIIKWTMFCLCLRSLSFTELKLIFL